MDLEKLGFSRMTYSEVILTIRLKETVNAAPMGILLNDDEEPRLKVRVYESQRTYEMILNGAGDCVLNITDDPLLFYNAIFRKDEISYIPAESVSSPRICDCKAYVECSINEVVKHGGYVEVFLKPLLINVTRRSVKTFNRAGPAIIEALICYSKLLYFKDADMEEAENLMKRIDIFRDIVYHSTKEETLRKAAARILGKSKELFPEGS